MTTPVSEDRLRRALARAQAYFRDGMRDHEPAGQACDARGLPETVRARYGLGYAPRDWRSLLAAIGDTDAALEVGLASRANSGHVYARFRDRLMFPIHDADGRLCGFSGRSMGDGKPKYLNTPESEVFKKSELIYGLHEIGGLAPGQRIVVCEGYTDAIASTVNGQPAVAAMGTTLSHEQLALLADRADGIVLCMDGDEAGQRVFDRMADRLLAASTPGFSIGVASLAYGMDPDELVQFEGGDVFRELIATAPSAGQRYVQDALASAECEGQMPTVTADVLAPHIAKVPDGMVQSLMVDEVARGLQTPAQMLFDFKASGITYYGDLDMDKPNVPTGSELAPDDARDLALRAVLSCPDVAQFAPIGLMDRRHGDPVLQAIASIADRVATDDAPSSGELVEQWESSPLTRGFAQRAMAGGILSPAISRSAIIGATRVLCEQRAGMAETDEFAPGAHI
jgi:DNA primase